MPSKELTKIFAVFKKQQQVLNKLAQPKLAHTPEGLKAKIESIDWFLAY